MISFTPAIHDYPVQGTDRIENHPHSASLGERDSHHLEGFPRIEHLSMDGEAALTKDAEEKNQKNYPENRSVITIGEARDKWLSILGDRDEHKTKAYTASLNQLIELGILNEQAPLSSFSLDEFTRLIENPRQVARSRLLFRPKRSMCRAVLAFIRYLNEETEVAIPVNRAFIRYLNLNRKKRAVISADTSDKRSKRCVNSQESLEKKFWQPRSFATLGEAQDLWFSTLGDTKKWHTVSLNRLITLGMIDKKASLSSFSLDKIISQIESSKEATLGRVSTHPKRTMRRTVHAFFRYLKGWEGDFIGRQRLDKKFWRDRSFITVGEAKDLWLSTIKREKKAYTASLNQLIDYGIFPLETPVSLFSSKKIARDITSLEKVTESEIPTYLIKEMLKTLGAFAQFLNKKMREVTRADTSNNNPPEPSIAKAARDAVVSAGEPDSLAWVAISIEGIVNRVRRPPDPNPGELKNLGLDATKAPEKV